MRGNDHERRQVRSGVRTEFRWEDEKGKKCRGFLVAGRRTEPSLVDSRRHSGEPTTVLLVCAFGVAKTLAAVAV